VETRQGEGAAAAAERGLYPVYSILLYMAPNRLVLMHEAPAPDHQTARADCMRGCITPRPLLLVACWLLLLLLGPRP
jgi:hypothetical protein